MVWKRGRKKKRVLEKFFLLFYDLIFIFYGWNFSKLKNRGKTEEKWTIDCVLWWVLFEKRACANDTNQRKLFPSDSVWKFRLSLEIKFYVRVMKLEIDLETTFLRFASLVSNYFLKRNFRFYVLWRGANWVQLTNVMRLTSFTVLLITNQQFESQWRRKKTNENASTNCKTVNSKTIMHS